MNAMLQYPEDEILARSTNKQGASSEHCGTEHGDGGKDKGKTTGRDILLATIQYTRFDFGPIELGKKLVSL